jgi:hypothetical protein
MERGAQEKNAFKPKKIGTGAALQVDLRGDCSRNTEILQRTPY